MKQKQDQKKQSNLEEGQAIVMGTGILLALGITFLFYLSIQRAYNLANFLDETAELAAQAAAEPAGDNIVSGDIYIDPADALAKAIATVNYSVDQYGREFSDDNLAYLINDATIDGDGGFEIKVINIGNPSTDDLCLEYKPGATPNNDCTFPIVEVTLSLPYRLFGIEFTIETNGVATLGANSRAPEPILPNLPTPTPIPAGPSIIITVGP